MKLARGNMFLHPASLILVTTNSYVRSNGTLVMGRGAASEIKCYYPPAESVFGHLVKACPGVGLKRYGVLLAPRVGNWLPGLPQYQWGIFQVKYHWNKPALPDLISHSTSKLMEIAHLYPSISLNFPGIGNGGLGRDEVLPLIECLPSNVTVWEL